MLAAGLLVVAVTAALVTLLIDSGDAAEKGASPATTSRSTTRSTDQPATTDPTTTTPTTTTPTTTTAAPPPQQQQPEQQPQQGPPATPAAAISAYYALMPGNLDQAWPLLTAKFQAYPALGRTKYATWWSKVSAVAVTDVKQTGTNTVEATILYTFTSGERRRELHRYTLVNQNGVWLIDEVTVVNSTPV
jgi:hypothetical protein